MPAKKKKGDEFVDGERPSRANGKKIGRPKKEHQNKPGEHFDTRKRKNQVVYEFEIHKVWPSGQAPMVGVTRTVTPEALGQTFGGGVFEAHKRHVDSKELVADPVIIEIDTGLFPEVGIDPIFRKASQQLNPMSHLWGGQGWQGPNAGNYPYQPQVMPWGSQPMDGAEAQDDGRVSELEDQIRDMKDEARAAKAQEKEAAMLRIMNEISAKLSNPQGQTGSSNNPLDIIRLMHEMNGPGAGKTDWIQTIVAAMPLLAGVKTFIHDLVKTKAATTGDMSEEMIKSILQMGEQFLASRATPAPVAPVNPAAPLQAQAPVRPTAPPKPTADEEMIIVRKKMIENLKILFQDGKPPQAAAQWIREQTGPFWDLVKDEIKDVRADGVVMFILSETKGVLEDKEKNWLKETVEFYLNDFPVTT